MNMTNVFIEQLSMSNRLVLSTYRYELAEDDGTVQLHQWSIVLCIPYHMKSLLRI